MNIIVSHPQDQEAIWLYLALKNNDIPIEIISPEELLMAEEWTQSINNEEDNFYIKTKKGVEISGNNLNFVFNRIQIASSPIWEKAEETEKQYVHAEMNALMMSWLHLLQQKCNIYNPSVGYSLSGVFWSHEQWEKAAYVAGFESVLAVKDQQYFESKKILVFGKKVIASCHNKNLIESCLELSRYAQTPFLEISVSEDETMFIRANTQPSLREYGSKLIAIIKHIINEN
ncbi:hypothetical protein OAT18_01840 [Tenacibaculum sp.]|nr:hypothetical protein [Tenacibaculum sp.]